MTTLISSKKRFSYLVLLFLVSVLFFGCSSKEEEVAKSSPARPELQPMPASMPSHSQTLTLKQIKENYSLLTLDSTFSGEVLETSDVREYTYVRLKDSTDTAWVAVSKPSRPLQVGETIKITNANVMTDFYSKNFDKTFDMIIFGQIFGLTDMPTASAEHMSSYDAGSHPPVAGTNSRSSVGSVVVAKGVLHVGKDFGAGYSFDAIIEDAQISIDE
jgi:hypothetical protein